MHDEEAGGDGEPAGRHPKGKVWKPGETRKSELVFIGRHLEDMSLTESFRACVVN